MSVSGLPPLTSTGVFTVSASITIDAPRDIVWGVLMDWGSYHEWHEPICVGTVYHIDASSYVLTLRSRNQCLTDSSRRPLPPSQQTPRAGAHLLIHPVHIPPSFDSPKLFPASSAFVVITHLEPDNHRCAWESIDYPPWLLTAVRWQALVEVVEDGRKKTRYETIEVFNGMFAYLIKIFVGNGLQMGYTAMAEGIKKRSEELSHLG